jgi:hypothetical protein
MLYNDWSARITRSDTAPRIEPISDREDTDEGDTTDPVHQLLSRWARHQETSGSQPNLNIFQQIRSQLKR